MGDISLMLSIAGSSGHIKGVDRRNDTTTTALASIPDAVDDD